MIGTPRSALTRSANVRYPYAERMLPFIPIVSAVLCISYSLSALSLRSMFVTGDPVRFPDNDGYGLLCPLSAHIHQFRRPTINGGALHDQDVTGRANRTRAA